MKIFIITDTHIGYANDSLEWHDIQKKYLFDVFLKDVKNNSNKKTDMIFHAGDVFHSRRHLNLRTMNLGLEFMYECSKLLPVICIAGNHDCHELTSNTINSLTPFKHIPSITVIDENPESINIPNFGKWLFMTWRHSKELELECINSDNSEFMLCHTDFKGIKFNKWSDVHEGYDTSTINKYKKVLSGHVHYRGIYNNLIIMGCPYEMDRSDSGNSKGYWIFEDNGNINFIENKISPRHIKLDISEMLEMDVNTIKNIINNNFVDLYFKGNDMINFSMEKFINVVGSSYKRLYSKTYNKIQEDLINSKDDIIIDKLDLNLKDITKKYIMDIRNEYSNNQKDILYKTFEKYYDSINNELKIKNN